MQSQLSSRIPASLVPPYKSPLQIIARLARRLEEVQHPSARACILWLVGQYAASTEVTAYLPADAIEGIADWAPDVLRKAAKHFSREASQLVTAVHSISKLYLSRLSPSSKLLH